MPSRHARPASQPTLGRLVLVASLVCLAGCATRLQGERIAAEAGVRSTRALAVDVDRFAESLEEGDAIAAFVATWRACNVSPGAGCGVSAPPSAEQTQRQELAHAVALRRSAVIALSIAYSAYRSDVDLQSGASAERAVKDALVSTANYATSLTGFPLVRSIVGGRPIDHVAGTFASALSLQQRRVETRERSRRLRSAVSELRETMLLEIQKYDALAEALVKQRTDAHRSMLQAGLISASGTLRPFADRLNVSLARDADAVVARSTPARTAIEAMVEASARREVRRTQMRYRAAIATLAELEQVHAELEQGRQSGLEELEKAVWDLERLSDPLAVQPRVVGVPLGD